VYNPQYIHILHAHLQYFVGTLVDPR